MFLPPMNFLLTPLNGQVLFPHLKRVRPSALVETNDSVPNNGFACMNGIADSYMKM